MNTLISVTVFCSLLPLGCASQKMNFNKARILDATMDPSKTGVAVSRLQDQPASLWEKAGGTSGTSIGGSCPTCGS